MVQQQAADLVARQRPVHPLAVAHADAQAVAIRIGAEDDAGAHLPSQRDRQPEGIGVFRIGGGHGGKIRVRQFLLGHNGHVHDTCFLQRPTHGDVAAAVQRRIDDLQVLPPLPHQLGGDQQAQHHLDVIVVNLFVTDGGEQAAFLRLAFIHRLAGAVGQAEHQVRNAFGHPRPYLRAVLGVYFIAVVLGRIVAGRDHHARDGAQMPHRVADDRHRPQRVKQHRLHAPGRKDQRGFPGEFGGHPAAVKADHNAALRPAGEALHIISQPRGEPAHVEYIHAVGARAKHAAHAGGAEAQLRIKPVLDPFGLVPDRFQFAHQGRFIRRHRQPGLIILHHRHRVFLHAHTQNRRYPIGFQVKSCLYISRFLL